jgi:hypothetical protein
VSEQVDALVAGLVHARLELLAAQLAAETERPGVNVMICQGCQVVNFHT